MHDKICETELIVRRSPAVCFLWRATEGWPVELVTDNIDQFGYSVDDFVSGRVAYASIVYPEDLHRVVEEVLAHSAAGDADFVQEYRIVTRSGQVRWVDDRTWVRRDGSGAITHYQGIILDITDRKRSEQELQDYRLHLEEMVAKRTEELENANALLREENAQRRQTQTDLESINRTLAVLSSCNQVLVRCTDESQLVSQVCHAIVETGGHLYASVFLHESGDSELRLVARASKGVEPESESGRACSHAEAGPVATAVRTGAIQQVVVGEGCPADLRNWSDKASSQGIRSVIALPIFSGDVVLGALMICSASAVAFSDEETKLLSELAADLAYGISSVRAHAQRALAESAERQQAVALRESESKYRTVIENIEDAFYRSDAEGKVIMASPSLPRMLGYDSLDEVIGKDIARDFYLHPEARGYLLEELARNGHVTNYEVTLRRKDGSALIVATNTRLRFDERGTPNGVEGLFRDITVFKQAETALRESKDRLQRFLGGSPIPCFVIGPDHRVVLWNDAVAGLTGLAAADMLGTCDHWRPFYAVERPCLADLLVDGDIDAITSWYGGKVERSKLIAEGFVGTDFFPALGKDGRWLHYTAAAVRDSAGVLIGAIETLEDFTERRLADQRLLQAQRVESVGRLAAGVAHDFNNMLTPIMGYAEFLIASLQPQDVRRSHAEQILVAAKSSRELTGKLLAISREQVLDLETVDLRQVIIALQPLLRTTIREDIDVQIQLAPEPCKVMADVGQIEQVLMNLAVNAQDAMPRGGALSISLGVCEVDESHEAASAGISPGSYVQLGVVDTGTGMDEHTREHAFEPFFTTKGPGAGTGLGLATVHGIIKQHGGTILLETRPGAGTAFRILLPAAATNQVGATAGEKATPRVPARGGETIMVVEDSAQVLTFTVNALELLGYRVIPASNPAECLQRLKGYRGRLDLLLTDVIMPNMNGTELARELHGQFPDAPTLYMSGHTQDVIAEHGVLKGIHLLRKPFSLQELSARVRAVLDEARSLQRSRGTPSVVRSRTPATSTPSVLRFRLRPRHGKHRST